MAAPLTFVENDSEPRNLMHWTFSGRKFSCKCMVSSQDNIGICHVSGFGPALWSVMYGRSKRATQMSGGKA